MAGGGRQDSRKTSTRSPILVMSTLVFFAISLIYFILSVFSSSPSSSSDALPLVHPSQNPSITVLNPKADCSFVLSLEKFLLTANSPPEKKLDDDPVASVNNLDDSIWITETRRLYHHQPPLPLPLRIYVYEMPSKFTYDLLFLFRNTYRDTSNLTSNGSPVHRLIQQHSIDYWLWADLIAPESKRLLKDVVVRVQRQEEADLFYIPFFTTISFFLLEKQHCKALYRV